MGLRLMTGQESSDLAAQEELLPFLLNPRSYPHRPRLVRLIQTHSSFVFLAPPFVYKIKKPVDFGFLDFSTLEKRRHFCEREVVLNRRLSPGIYLGVVRILRSRGEFVLDETEGETTRAAGAGMPVVEFAVKMRQLSERYFLDRLLERGEVGPREMDRVVDVLGRFYQAQKPEARVSAWGRIGRLKISTDENFRQTRTFVGRTLSRGAFVAIRQYTNRFYGRHRKLFRSRVDGGWIRDCHGDLHAEHIHLSPRALHIYDCIEFNDRFRYVDVASDVAFLAMDLDFEGRSDLSGRLVQRMAQRLKDPAMDRLVTFYKCYRAYVRGKVESLHSVAHAAPEAERRQSAAAARRYFRLALQYAVGGSKPLVLVVMGRIASGKTTLAAALGEELGWKVLSSDRTRKELAGFPVYERSDAVARRRLYSAVMTRRTYRVLLAGAESEARAGRSVILDATFGRRDERRALAMRLERRGIVFRFLEARVTEAEIRRRLRRREHATHEVSDARLEDFAALVPSYEPPTELPIGKLIRLRTQRDPEQVVVSALESLAAAE